MQAVAQERGGVSGTLLGDYMAECRTLALDELRRILPSTGSVGKVLYERMLDYPMRDAKALRPALCIATCRALGGTLESVLKTAAVLELYHNAFLIHDDVEDGSDMRRNAPTLHKVYGVPIAVNIGDAMLAAALEPLLQNMAVLGLGKALRILQTVATMARESAEGQAPNSIGCAPVTGSFVKRTTCGWCTRKQPGTASCHPWNSGGLQRAQANCNATVCVASPPRLVLPFKSKTTCST